MVLYLGALCVSLRNIYQILWKHRMYRSFYMSLQYGFGVCIIVSKITQTILTVYVLVAINKQDFCSMTHEQCDKKQWLASRLHDPFQSLFWCCEFEHDVACHCKARRIEKPQEQEQCLELGIVPEANYGYVCLGFDSVHRVLELQVQLWGRPDWQDHILGAKPLACNSSQSAALIKYDRFILRIRADSNCDRDDIRYEALLQTVWSHARVFQRPYQKKATTCLVYRTFDFFVLRTRFIFLPCRRPQVDCQKRFLATWAVFRDDSFSRGTKPILFVCLPLPNVLRVIKRCFLTEYDEHTGWKIKQSTGSIWRGWRGFAFNAND